MKRGVYSLGSQHTVTRNFIHGRGGPSSVGRAGKNKERDRFKYAAHLLKPDKQFIKRHMHMLNEIFPSNLLFGGLSWIISWIIKTRKAEQQWSCFPVFIILIPHTIHSTSRKNYTSLCHWDKHLTLIARRNKNNKIYNWECSHNSMPWRLTWENISCITSV